MKRPLDTEKQDPPTSDANTSAFTMDCLSDLSSAPNSSSANQPAAFNIPLPEPSTAESRVLANFL